MSSLGVCAFASPFSVAVVVVEEVLPVLSSLAGEALLLLLLRVRFADDLTGAESSPSLATDLSAEDSFSSLLLLPLPLLERVRVRGERVEGAASLSESLLSLDSTAVSLLSEPFEEEDDDDDDDLVARGVDVDDDEDVALLSLLVEDAPESESDPDDLDVLDSLLLLLLSVASGGSVVWVAVVKILTTTIMRTMTRKTNLTMRQMMTTG